MSRWSGRRRSRSAASARAQVEPTAALAAVAVFAVALAAFAGSYQGAMPTATSGDAAPVLSLVAHEATAGGVLRPDRLAVPAGTDRANVTLRAAGRRWTVGPPIPAGDADVAARPVAVRVERDTVRPGRLRVVAW